MSTWSFMSTKGQGHSLRFNIFKLLFLSNRWFHASYYICKCSRMWQSHVWISSYSWLSFVFNRKLDPLDEFAQELEKREKKPVIRRSRSRSLSRSPRSPRFRSRWVFLRIIDSLKLKRLLRILWKSKKIGCLKVTVIILKLEQCGFTIQQCVQNCRWNGKQCVYRSDLWNISLIWVYILCPECLNIWDH